MMKKTFEKRVKNEMRVKSEWISFRLTEREKQQIKLMMEAYGFNNKTDFIKFCIFEKQHDVGAVTDLKKYWERVNHYMDKIKKETLIYELEARKSSTTTANKECFTY